MPYETIVLALRETLRAEMKRDPRVFVLGEDIGVFGGAYQVTSGLMAEFGEDRVRDTPIAEIIIIGAAVGAAMTGMRPVAEIQFTDFIACGFDQVTNQAAKMRLMTGGKAKVPMVIRAPFGATGRGAQHSQSTEAWYMHTPGLKVAMPATPYDAAGLLRSAIRDDNPVLFFEHKLLYGGASPGGKAKSAVGEMARFLKPAPEEDYIVPFGVAEVRRTGKHVTVVATSYMMHRSLMLAERLAEQGIELEVIDPRTLVPLDIETIVRSVQKTHRLVVVSEDHLTGGVGAEIVALVADQAFDYLDAPPQRVSSLDVPMPFAPRCEEYVLPGEARIEKAIRSII